MYKKAHSKCSEVGVPVNHPDAKIDALGKMMARSP